ncbi:SDR family oxidoreductase [bacterium]|nr:SDR family oxidoreductase [bacterium]
MAVMYEDLIDKNVLVTGGASGLGFAIAQAFVENRSKVVIVGRDAEKLTRAQRELGEQAVSLVFDLNEIDRLPELLSQISNAVEAIEVLVNNAGINLKKEALAVSNQEYQAIVHTNQTAVFALTREIARIMVARGSGSVIMIGSMATHYGVPQVVGYAAAKSAVEGMTRVLAVEWASHGIRVNCIAPGFIATVMSAKAFADDPERKARALARTPMGKFGEPSEVASAALFLASAQAKYITGVVLAVDGGNSIGF